MSERIATIIGATGLIGNEVRQRLQRDPFYTTIRILTRRPIEKSSDREEIKLINFQDPESFKLGIEGSDAVFVAVGTTRRKVKGDLDAYRRVDFDIAVHAARYAAETGCRSFLIVSSVGASTNSRYFYLKLKGEVEEALGQASIPSIHILRPATLIGKRSESRPGEKMAAAVMKWLDFLVPKKYKPIDASIVAQALIRLSKESGHGYFIHENPEIKKMAELNGS